MTAPGGISSPTCQMKKQTASEWGGDLLQATGLLAAQPRWAPRPCRRSSMQRPGCMDRADPSSLQAVTFGRRCEVLTQETDPRARQFQQKKEALMK